MTTRLGVERSATFSPCRTWRYVLRRRWDTRYLYLPCMLCNPSDANEHDDDPTVRVLMNYADRIGYGGLWIMNPFALVSSDPGALRSHADPVGPENARHIQLMLLALGGRAPGQLRDVLCGWGDVASQGWGARAHIKRVLGMIDDVAGARAVSIGLTKRGNPGHPTRKRLPDVPFDWRVA